VLYEAYAYARKLALITPLATLQASAGLKRILISTPRGLLLELSTEHLSRVEPG